MELRRKQSSDDRDGSESAAANNVCIRYTVFGEPQPGFIARDGARGHGPRANGLMVGVVGDGGCRPFGACGKMWTSALTDIAPFSSFSVEVSNNFKRR